MLAPLQQGTLLLPSAPRLKVRRLNLRAVVTSQRLFLSVGLLLWTSSSNADQAWQLYKTAPGIQLYQRHVLLTPGQDLVSNGQESKTPDSKVLEIEMPEIEVLEIKVQLEYQGKLAAFLHLLKDTEHAASWLHNVAHVRLLQQRSVNEDVVYSQFSAPWPLADRELISCSSWTQDSSFRLQMKVSDCGDLQPADPAKIRLRHFYAKWQLQLQPDGKVQLQYSGTANAGGNVPKWLSDPMVLLSSWRSFNGLKTEIEQPVYQQPYPGICEMPYLPDPLAGKLSTDKLSADKPSASIKVACP